MSNLNSKSFPSKATKFMEIGEMGNSTEYVRLSTILGSIFRASMNMESGLKAFYDLRMEVSSKEDSAKKTFMDLASSLTLAPAKLAATGTKEYQGNGEE